MAKLDPDNVELLRKLRKRSADIDRRIAQRNEAIVALREEGVPARVIAEAAGMSHTQVMRIAKAAIDR